MTTQPAQEIQDKAAAVNLASPALVHFYAVQLAHRALVAVADGRMELAQANAFVATRRQAVAQERSEVLAAQLLAELEPSAFHSC